MQLISKPYTSFQKSRRFSLYSESSMPHIHMVALSGIMMPPSNTLATHQQHISSTIIARRRIQRHDAAFSEILKKIQKFWKVSAIIFILNKVTSEHVFQSCTGAEPAITGVEHGVQRQQGKNQKKKLSWSSDRSVYSESLRLTNVLKH